MKALISKYAWENYVTRFIHGGPAKANVCPRADRLAFFAENAGNWVEASTPLTYPSRPDELWVSSGKLECTINIRDVVDISDDNRLTTRTCRDCRFLNVAAVGVCARCKSRRLTGCGTSFMRATGQLLREQVLRCARHHYEIFPQKLGVADGTSGWFMMRIMERMPHLNNLKLNGNNLHFVCGEVDSFVALPREWF